MYHKQLLLKRKTIIMLPPILIQLKVQNVKQVLLQPKKNTKNPFIMSICFISMNRMKPTMIQIFVMAQHGLLQSNKVDLSENGVVLTSIHHYGIDSEKLLIVQTYLNFDKHQQLASAFLLSILKRVRYDVTSRTNAHK